MSTIARSRPVEHVRSGQPTSDGADVTINRVVDHRLARRLDPFLMLDNFGSNDPRDYIAGFPDHPHRGFETVTYMLHGRMRHRDSAGNEGLLENGGVQWMTAGRGVIHSEMPEQEEGRMEGFQLWLNLPAADKLRAPWYRDIQNADLPRFRTDTGVEGFVIAGEAQGVTGAVQRDRTEPLYLDVHLPAGATFDQPLPATHNAFVFVYQGKASVGGTPVQAGQMGILANDPQADGVRITGGDAEARLILLAGRPLGEPVVQYGPFVMNTEQQIRDAIRDFREGRLA